MGKKRIRINKGLGEPGKNDPVPWERKRDGGKRTSPTYRVRGYGKLTRVDWVGNRMKRIIPTLNPPTVKEKKGGGMKSPVCLRGEEGLCGYEKIKQGGGKPSIASKRGGNARKKRNEKN